MYPQWNFTSRNVRHWTRLHHTNGSRKWLGRRDLAVQPLRRKPKGPSNLEWVIRGWVCQKGHRDPCMHKKASVRAMRQQSSSGQPPPSWLVLSSGPTLWIWPQKMFTDHLLCARMRVSLYIYDLISTPQRPVGHYGLSILHIKKLRLRETCLTS